MSGNRRGRLSIMSREEEGSESTQTIIAIMLVTLRSKQSAKHSYSVEFVDEEVRTVLSLSVNEEEDDDGKVSGC